MARKLRIIMNTIPSHMMPETNEVIPSNRSSYRVGKKRILTKPVRQLVLREEKQIDTILAATNISKDPFHI